MERPTLPLIRKNILIVEDDEPFRLSLCRFLEIEGFTVRQAPDGQAALDLLPENSVDLIISDIRMPRLNGIEFYKIVRKDLRWVTIPFIFVTSYDQPEDITAGRLLGVEDYLTKPLDQHELVKIVTARLLRSAEIEIAHINQSYLETVKVLANAIEGRDPFTHEHVERVATYSRRLAEALNWTEEHLRILEFGARLHDIGKIIIPDTILKKNGPLSQEEWILMRQHPDAGARMIFNISHLRGTIPYILYHHERWNGSGYPHGIGGREIPLEGRLLAIADVYDALTSVRPYHPARPKREVAQYLQFMSGKAFDPDLVSLFIEAVHPLS